MANKEKTVSSRLSREEGTNITYNGLLERTGPLSNTKKKYTRDIFAFTTWLNKRELKKSIVLEYKQYLINTYAPASVNSILSSLNNFFEYTNLFECKVKTLKIQKQLFVCDNKELSKDEYEKLLNAAQQKKNERLFLLMQTICSTGIRVSELKYITVDSIKNKQAIINNKGKFRVIIIPKQLCKMLTVYINSRNINSGCVFITKTGKPLSRSNIWNDMKKLCEIAGISKEKVFPHNLRHLFARTYYAAQKDIVRLADVLGHTSINTTRIYTIETGNVHRRQIQKLGLLNYEFSYENINT